MMMIGLVGMPLSLWLFTPERAPAPPAPVPRVQETPPPARAPALAPTETVGPAGPPETPAASEPAQTIEQPVRQTPDTEDSDPSVPLTQAIEYVARVAGAKAAYDDHAVLFTSAGG